MVFLMALVVLHWRSLLSRWKAGLGLGLLVFVLNLPSVVAMVSRIDVAKVVKSDLSPPLTAMAFYVGAALSQVLFLAKACWHCAVYGAALAEWEGIGGDAAPVNRPVGRGHGPFILGAFLFGLVAGLASIYVFHWLGVRHGVAVQQAADLLTRYGREGRHAAAAPLGPTFSFVAVLMAFVATALIEELAYRGALLGFLLRLSGKRPMLVALAEVIVSGLWALQHLNTTSAPGAKVVQIFLLGLILCEIARRRCVEGAFAVHAGLNVAAVVLPRYVII